MQESLTSILVPHFANANLEGTEKVISKVSGHIQELLEEHLKTLEENFPDIARNFYTPIVTALDAANKVIQEKDGDYQEDLINFLGGQLAMEYKERIDKAHADTGVDVVEESVDEDEEEVVAAIAAVPVVAEAVVDPVVTEVVASDGETTAEAVVETPAEAVVETPAENASEEVVTEVSPVTASVAVAQTSSEDIGASTINDGGMVDLINNLGGSGDLVDNTTTTVTTTTTTSSNPQSNSSNNNSGNNTKSKSLAGMRSVRISKSLYSQALSAYKANKKANKPRISKFANMKQIPIFN